MRSVTLLRHWVRLTTPGYGYLEAPSYAHFSHLPLTLPRPSLRLNLDLLVPTTDHLSLALAYTIRELSPLRRHDFHNVKGNPKIIRCCGTTRVFLLERERPRDSPSSCTNKRRVSQIPLILALTSSIFRLDFSSWRSFTWTCTHQSRDNHYPHIKKNGLVTRNLFI